MTIEDATNLSEGPTPAQAPSASTTPDAAPTGTPARAQQPPNDSTPEEPKQPKTKLAADGEDIELDDNERVNLPYGAFQKRLKQAQRAALRELFGTDNPDEIRKNFKAGQSALKKLEDEQKRQMTEAERYKAELESQRKKAAEAESQLQRYQQEQAASKGETVVRGIAGRFIQPDYIDDAVAMYQRHLSKLDDEEIDALEVKDIDTWFEEYSGKRPAMALKGKAEARKETRPINNGAGQPRPDDSRATATSKTPRPGKQNTMTASEWELWKRENGLDF
jgi:hypothetical protein